jgi:uncharacterized membrane protein YuzA (DUF378 family)
MFRNNKLLIAALVLVIIGALNWGLIAINGTNAVTMATSAVGLDMSTQEIVNRVIYALVGVSGVAMAVTAWQHRAE